MMEQPTAVPAAPATPPAPERRGLVAGLAALATGAFISLTPLAAGVMFALDPIRRQRPKFRGANAEGFLPVTTLSRLPTDGTPVRFTIRADKLDVYSVFKDQTIGTVYLRQMVGAVNPVIAYSDVCPHLGCKVNYQTSSKTFYCPCHASTFDLDGHKTNKIPPRDMDTLDVKVEQDGSVWVKFQDFRGAIAEKVPT